MSLDGAFDANRAGTDPESADPDLRGRTYAIPFARVWDAALTLAGGGLRRWSVVSADDLGGEIDAEVRIPLVGWVDDVHVEVRLDPDAQTRVDVVSSTRDARRDLGRNRRRIRRFCQELDRALGAPPHQILDPHRHAG